MHLITAFYITLLSCTVWPLRIAEDAEITSICAREPPRTNSERNPGDGGFRITIDDNPSLRQYVPERLYRISISGTSREHMFSGAYLVAVPFNSSTDKVSEGEFHLVDGGHLASHVACPNVITTVDSIPKAEVYVMWTSPIHISGCVEFRATVIDGRVWYKDSGALTKVICPEHTVHGNVGDIHGAADISSMVDCCACGTAKYQLTFQSLWSRSNTPSNNILYTNKSLLQWSPVVGSSHSKHYGMWHFNTLASQGVGDLCQFGDTRALEDEIRHQSSNIRTVIKTPGIQWSKERGLHQQRWAHFSVDRKHHLLSILSRLSPSPDWCVGVSALDLCLSNCTWLTDITVELFAWDAGVRSGGGLYTSENRQSSRAQPIRHLPAHASNKLPFRRGRPTQAVALLRLHRFDPKPDGDAEDAVCANAVAKDQGTAKPDDPGTEVNHRHRNSCVMGSWSDWSRCSVSCGIGTRTRSRSAVRMTDTCSDMVQTRSEPCGTSDCVGNCDLHEWSEWSACTDGFVLCHPDVAYAGKCSRRRSRFYRHPGAEAFCSHSMEQEKRCQPSSDSEINAVFDLDMMSRCFAPADSGPCSGNHLRWYYNAILNECLTFLYGGCRGNANRYVTEEHCMRVCRQYEVHTELKNTDDGVDGKMLLGGIVGTTKTQDSADFSRDVNAATPGTTTDCVMSSWSAWSGCSVSCGGNGVQTRQRTVMRPPTGNGHKCPRRRLRRKRCSMPACSASCQYTEWSSWSTCARSCGADTVQERVQRVPGSQSQQLSSCPVKLQRRMCTLPHCPQH